MGEVSSQKGFDLSPKNLQEAMEFAKLLSQSEIVPKDYLGKPANIIVAIQWGMELGLKPMQAMQNIAVINGRPSLWGDAVIAMARNSPLCEYIYEAVDNGVATCRVKRKGEDEQVRTFSEAEASAAGLLNKQGPWKQYKNRMLQMRARAFALRDVFPDVLKGIPIAEEVMDYSEFSQERDVTPKAAEPKQIQYYPSERFDQNFPAWEDAIKSGKKSADEVINTISSRGKLTEDQINKINNVEVSQ